MGNAIFAVASILLAFSAPVQASCYGSGYARYCDGIGGSGATYSNRGGNGSTYYQGGGGRSRTETYQTTPNYGGGYTRQTYTNYYGR
jgi:hypothetical protein